MGILVKILLLLFIIKIIHSDLYQAIEKTENNVKGYFQEAVLIYYIYKNCQENIQHYILKEAKNCITCTSEYKSIVFFK